MITYPCLNCNEFHGWGDHPNVTKVTRHSRLPGEDIWYCPNCEREHRTTGGTMLGQVRKMWKVIDDPDNFVPDSELLEFFADGRYIIRKRWR